MKRLQQVSFYGALRDLLALALGNFVCVPRYGVLQAPAMECCKNPAYVPWLQVQRE